MKAYLCTWRDDAGNPTAHQIVLAVGICTAMRFADTNRPTDHASAHASFHRLHRRPETLHAIRLAENTPMLPLLATPEAAACMSLGIQEDMTAAYAGKSFTLARWAFIERGVSWERAQAVMEQCWDRGDYHKLGPRYTYSIENAVHHLRSWTAPLAAYDLDFPESA